MSGDVEVIIPWRAGCPHRERAFRWVLEQWDTNHPTWKVTVASAPPGEWCKAVAVNPAVARSAADLVVVADADVWVSGVAEAVAQIAQGARWAVPHLMVHRLTEGATDAVLGGAQPNDVARTNEIPYKGVPGGGVVVLPRATALDIPLDPRFRGWGGEDHAWGYALWNLEGEPWRGAGPLWHLWHPPQPRESRRVGSYASERLRRRYRDVQFQADMRALVDEAKAVR